MVPTSLIMAILTVAFVASAFNHFCRFPHPKVVDSDSLLMCGAGALMLFTVTLAIIDLHVVWLSWVLLAAAISGAITAIQLWRTALRARRARDRALAARMAKGY